MKLRTQRHFRPCVPARVSAHPLAHDSACGVGVGQRHAVGGYIPRPSEQEFAAGSRKLLP
jgi:hypothetical protein